MTHKTVQSKEGVDNVLQVAANANAWHMRDHQQSQELKSLKGHVQAAGTESGQKTTQNPHQPSWAAGKNKAPGLRRVSWAHETSAWAEINPETSCDAK